MGTVIRIICGVTVLAGVSLLARSDDKRLDDGQLENKATHVVVGTVRGVYTSESDKDKGVTHYVIEIEVEGVQKGQGPKSREVLYARCWKRKEKPESPDISNGQAEIPAVSAYVRVYLKRGKDGGYDTLEPNGIGRPPSKK
jgi:hypothetical protein